MRQRFTKEQVLHFLQQAREGVPITEICHLGGFSNATFYRWRRRWDTQVRPVSTALNQVSDKTHVLRKLMADQHLQSLDLPFFV